MPACKSPESTTLHPIPQEAFDRYDEYALAKQVSFNDPEITARYEVFPSPGGAWRRPRNF